MKGIAGYIRGLTTVFRSLELLRANGGLFRLAVTPFLITLVLYGVFVTVAVSYYDTLYESFVGASDAWYGAVLSWAGFIGFLVALLFVSIFTFMTVGALITKPFNGFISQKTEALQTSKEVPDVGILRDLWLTVTQELARILLYMTLCLLVVPLLFIPLLNAAYPFVMAIITVRYLAWDALDYCMGRRGMSFREKSEFLRQNRAVTLGVGTQAFLLFLIPFGALFVFPLNAVSGTIIYCEIQRRIGEAVDREDVSGP